MDLNHSEISVEQDLKLVDGIRNPESIKTMTKEQLLSLKKILILAENHLLSTNNK